MSSETTTGSPAARTDEAVVHPNAQKPRIRRGVIVGILLLLAVVAACWYFYSQRFEDTDDAEVDGHLIPITSRIDGTVTAVHVDDNQTVEVGNVLVELDRRDYRVAFDQAKAQLDQATAQVTATDPNLPITQITNRTDMAGDVAQVAAAEAALGAARHDLAAASAKLKQSQAESERAQANFKRYQTLLDKNEVARADYDQYKAEAAAEIQSVAANQASVESSGQIVNERQAQLDQQQSKLQETRSSGPLRLAIREADIKSERASAEAAEAALEKANLNLMYAKIVAPVAGVVTQRSAELGARVSSGQQLMMIVQTNDLWVTANFKETQLVRMHPGERVRIHVDALHRDFDGTVKSMPAITGARTSVLPPENATGNYVKVIQRMSVRIRFNPGQPDLDKLRPGMSVEPRVSLD